MRAWHKKPLAFKQNVFTKVCSSQFYCHIDKMERWLHKKNIFQTRNQTSKQVKKMEFNITKFWSKILFAWKIRNQVVIFKIEPRAYVWLSLGLRTETKAPKCYEQECQNYLLSILFVVPLVVKFFLTIYHGLYFDQKQANISKLFQKLM